MHEICCIRGNDRYFGCLFNSMSVCNRTCRIADEFITVSASVIPDMIRSGVGTDHTGLIAGMLVPCTGCRRDQRIFGNALPAGNPVFGPCRTNAGGIDVTVADVEHQIAARLLENLTDQSPDEPHRLQRRNILCSCPRLHAAPNPCATRWQAYDRDSECLRLKTRQATFPADG